MGKRCMIKDFFFPFPIDYKGMKIMEKSKHFHYQSLRNSSYNTFIFCSLGIIDKKDCGNVTPPLYIHIKVPHVIQLSTDCVLQWTLKSSLKIIISILFLVIVTHKTLKFSHETLAKSSGWSEEFYLL